MSFLAMLNILVQTQSGREFLPFGKQLVIPLVRCHIYICIFFRTCSNLQPYLQHVMHANLVSRLETKTPLPYVYKKHPTIQKFTSLVDLSDRAMGLTSEDPVSPNGGRHTQFKVQG